MNNSIASYANKGRHYGGTSSLLTRVLVAAGVHLVGHHHLWTSILTLLEVHIPYQLNLQLLTMDKERAVRFHRDHDYQYKKRRKRLEHDKFRQEYIAHQKDVARNATYQSCTRCEGGGSPEVTSTCVHAKFGCKGKNKHKTERSKHCDYNKNKLGTLSIAEAQAIWTEANRGQGE